MQYVPAKTIVTRTKGTGWFGSNYNMNIYRGCCHGCIYCDSRSDCYHVENFDEVRAKENALEIIRNDLRSKVRKGIIATGAMSDPYNPFEKELKLTRNALELVNAYEFGIAIDTKSDLVVRDADILRDIKTHSPVLVKITVTAADELSRLIEPNAPVSSKRLAALRELTEQRIFAGLLLMPVLPFIEDTPENILSIVRLASEAGARFIYPAFGVTLRQNQREYYYKELDKRFPGVKERYIKQYGDAYQCVSPRAKELWQLFSKECDSRGILYKMQDIVSVSKQGYGDMQLSFFK